MIPGLTPGHTAVMASGATSGGYVGMQYRTVRDLTPTVHAMTRLAIIVGQRVVVRFSVTIRAPPVDLVVVHREHILPTGPWRMTSRAPIGGIGMSGRFIHQVASFAGAIDLIVIHGKHRIPLGACGMTGRTVIGGIRMGGRFITIVTGLAGTVNLGVINRIHGYPSIVVMARLAHVRGIYVGSGFAGGGGAVVAVKTRLP